MRYYCAGAMRGRKNLAFDLFDAARDKLLAEGHDVVSPADLDRAHGFDAMDLPDDWDWNTLPDIEILKLDKVIARDVLAILECDGIYMLKGWLWSVGAFAEWAVALWAGKEVRFEEEPCIYTAWMAIGPKLKRRAK